MRALLLAVACILSMQSAPRGFSPGEQARDTAPTPVAGTARISGQVLGAGADPKPLRRVIVTVTAEGAKVGRSTVTDDQGRFAIDALPPGRFSVTATKPAYLPGGFGVTQPGRPGVPIPLKAGESRTDVSFTMLKGAVVTGVIRTESGEPAANVDVTVFRLPSPGSDPRLIVSGSTTSDDRGAYRIYDLAPGAYVVAGALRRRGVSTGDAPAWTAAQVTEILRELEQREKSAGSAAPAPMKLPTPPSGTYAYAPVFFPGSASADMAVPIRLRPGEERSGIDFTVQLTRMATVEGLLIGADAADAALFFNPVGVQLPSLMGNTPTFSSKAEPGGRAFEYAGVTPGRYTITAQARSGTAWARAEVIVTGDDVSGVTLALQPSLRITGQVVFKGSSLAAPENIAAVVVRLTAANGLGQSSAGSTRMGNPLIQPGRVQADGRFEISGVLPDVYRLTANVPGAAGWWLRSAVANGRDLLDTMVEVTGDITDAVLTFSDQRASLSGQLITSGGPPAAPYFIVAFPSDRTLWLPLARRIVSTRADTSGRWNLRDLPPGEYLLAALTDLAPDELSDATFLEQLVPSALKVVLADGENKVQDLRIGG
jgi:hypothetical protein